MTERERPGLSAAESQLISRYHDREVDAEEAAEAERLLAENEAALHFFAELTALRAEFQGDVVTASPTTEESAQARPRPAGRRKAKAAKIKRTSSETLDRLHRRSDSSNKKTTLVLGSVLLFFFVLVIVAVRATREDEKEKKEAREVAKEVETKEPELDLPERQRLAVLVDPEGLVVNRHQPDRPLKDEVLLWDGEAVEAAADGGGVLKLLGGGRIEFGPHSRVALGDGGELLARAESGFLALDFERADVRGRVELGDFGRVEARRDLRVVVHCVAASPAPRRALYLHVRRGEAHLELLGEKLVLPAMTSAAFQIEREGDVQRIVSRVALSPGPVKESGPITTNAAKGEAVRAGGKTLMVVSGDQKQLVPDPRRVEVLGFAERVLARDLLDQARGLADGELVGVDMFTYLNEKSSLDSGLQVLGVTEGDILSDVVVTVDGEILAQGPLFKIESRVPEQQLARFDRLLGEALSPVIGRGEKDALEMLKADPKLLGYLARVWVTVPDELQDEVVFVRPKLKDRPALLMRAVASQLGCDIVNTDDGGISLVPRDY